MLRLLKHNFKNKIIISNISSNTIFRHFSKNNGFDKFNYNKNKKKSSEKKEKIIDNTDNINNNESKNEKEEQKFNNNQKKYYYKSNFKFDSSNIKNKGIIKFLIKNIISLIIFNTAYSYFFNNKNVSEINYTQFYNEYLTNNNISYITVDQQRESNVINYYLIITPKNNTKKVKLFVPNIDNFIENFEQFIKNNNYEFPNIYLKSTSLSPKDILLYGSNLALNFSYLLLIYFISKNLTFFNRMFNKISKKKDYTSNFKTKTPTTKFSDIAGSYTPKLEIQEFVNFLKNPEKYNKLGAIIPRGALLTGPPGTGKTMLARAAAHESSVPFYYASGPEFVEKYVGTGSKRVRELFKLSKQSQNGALIFIDEIDAIGKKRNSGIGNEEVENTLNQLLVEMDGFEEFKNIVVFAATNRPDILDPALKRPGRFDREIQIGLPDRQERKEILQKHIQKIKVNPENVDMICENLSIKTTSLSGSELENIINEAAILAIRRDSGIAEEQDFNEALNRVIMGIKRTNLMNEQEKNSIAITESSKALISFYFESLEKVSSISILPRTRGNTNSSEKIIQKDSKIADLNVLKEKIIYLISGRIGEELILGNKSNICKNELEKASEIAYDIVTKYSLLKEENNMIFNLDDNNNKDYSKDTNNFIDTKIKEIINDCELKCADIIKKYKEKIQLLANEVVIAESVNSDKINLILSGVNNYKNN